MKTVKVAVSGAAGQISYGLLFRLASGEVFGKDCAVHLHLLELPQAVSAANGVAMELNDCGFPTLAAVEIFSDPQQAFDGVHWALLVGAKPRTAGMERSDLLLGNARIFVEQGKALARADAALRVVVVGNPCNTNAMIAAHSCPEVLSVRFTAMTMLDENRAKAQLAHKLQVSVGQVENLIVWGNHSPTMYPDFENATVSGKPVTEQCPRAWLEGEFMHSVRQRGAEIIKARGSSSAASAANACLDHVKRLNGTTNTCFSAAVVNDKERYGVPAGVVYSFPITSDGKDWHIADDVKLSAYARQNLAVSRDELLAEKKAVREFIG